MARRTKVLIAVLIIGSLALATAVGVFVYQMTVKNALKRDLDTTALASVLVAPDEDAGGFWGVIARTDATSAETGKGNLTHVALVRVSTDGEGISFIWIPMETRVYVAGYGYQTIQETFSLQGESSVVEVLGNLAGVDISHYAEVNSAGLSRLAGEFDASDAGEGEDENSALVDAITAKLCTSSSEQASSLASSVSTCVSVDMTADDLTRLLRSIQDTQAGDIYQVEATVEEQQENGKDYMVLESEAWVSMIARAANGMSPVANERELETYAAMRDSVTVDVWNGVGVSGVAADCTSELEELGWTVGETGNAAQYVYEETFIVYRDSDDEDLAELLAADLGQGRIVKSNARYSYTGDLLVVIGEDYQPY